MGGGILQIAEHDLGKGRCELQLEGELDLWSVERLQAVLQRVARTNDAILVGLQGCDFVDSTGIALSSRRAASSKTEAAASPSTAARTRCCGSSPSPA